MEKLLELYSKYKEYILFTLVLVLSIGLQILSFYYFTQEINNLKDRTSEQKPVSQQEEVKTTKNPETGISDYAIYLVPVCLILGSTLLLKRRYS